MKSFEQRAVAFLDILGFSAFIKSAEKSPAKLKLFRELKKLIEDHVRFDSSTISVTVPHSVHPLYLFVSDSIILSAPLSDGAYDGLAVVSAKSIELAQKLLEKGYLVKGGISVGWLWHERTNIFGTAYMEAFKLQERIRGPQIVLSSAAYNHLQTALPGATALKDYGLWRFAKYRAYIDVLHSYYFKNATAPQGITLTLESFAELIKKNIGDSSLPRKANRKWCAMRAVFNNYLRRHGEDAASI